MDPFEALFYPPNPVVFTNKIRPGIDDRPYICPICKVEGMRSYAYAYPNKELPDWGWYCPLCQTRFRFRKPCFFYDIIERIWPNNERDS